MARWVQGFRAPEVFHAQPFDPELSAQFLDPILHVRPAVVAAPDRQSVHTGGQVGEEGLQPISLQFQQRLCGRPADGLSPAGGSRLTAGPVVPMPPPAPPVLGKAPPWPATCRLIVRAEGLHLLRQLGHKNELQAPATGKVACTLASPNPESPAH